METINKKETKFWIVSRSNKPKDILDYVYLSLESAINAAEYNAKNFVGSTYIVFEAVAGIGFLETQALHRTNFSYIEASEASSLSNICGLVKNSNAYGGLSSADYVEGVRNAEW